MVMRRVDGGRRGNIQTGGGVTNESSNSDQASLLLHPDALESQADRFRISVHSSILEGRVLPGIITISIFYFI